MNSKVIFTLIGLFLAIFAINSFSREDNVRENFMGMLPRTIIPQPLENNKYGLKQNYKLLYNPNMNNSMFQVPGTWQSQLEPRFMNASVGANIRYNPPDQKNMAAPCNPLTFSNMVEENYNPNSREEYCGSCSSPAATCSPGGLGGKNMSVGGIPPTPHNSAYNQAMKSLDYTNVQSELPAGDMTVMSSDGNVANPIVYNRMIYANRKSNLWFGGRDMIRGSVAAVPRPPGWFSVSVAPNKDLTSGALAVLGGVNNETANDLWKLQYASSAGFQTALGGENLQEVNYSTTGVDGGVNVSTNDINYTSFP